MKKILSSILIVVILVTITGCKNTNEINTNKGEKEDTIVATIEDLTLPLKYSGSFNEISYKYPEKAMTSNLGTYSIIDYMNGDEFIFRVAMYCFKNKTIDQTMSNSSFTSKGTKLINEKDWNIYEGKSQDGKNLINYAYQYNDNTYTITFIFDKDISNFIDVFMNTIKFN